MQDFLAFEQRWLARLAEARPAFILNPERGRESAFVAARRSLMQDNGGTAYTSNLYRVMPAAWKLYDSDEMLAKFFHWLGEQP